MILNFISYFNINNKKKEKISTKKKIFFLHLYHLNNNKNIKFLIKNYKDYKFANGCRATPWRQIYNELGYIKVLPKDKEKIIITACINGFFINKGYVTNDKGNYKLVYIYIFN